MEAIQKISDDPLTDCPECSQGQLKKLISAAGFRLKGGGWYETDFKSGKKKNVIQESAKAADSTTSKSADKGDSTKAPAKKTESKS